MLQCLHLSRNFKLEEISAQFIRKIVADVEVYERCSLTQIVITARVCFKSSQREATKYARTNVVSDLGGRTFGVSILNIVLSIFKFISTVGNTRVGGNKSTNYLID